MSQRLSAPGAKLQNMSENEEDTMTPGASEHALGLRNARRAVRGSCETLHFWSGESSTVGTSLETL